MLFGYRVFLHPQLEILSPMKKLLILSLACMLTACSGGSDDVEGSALPNDADHGPSKPGGGSPTDGDTLGGGPGSGDAPGSGGGSPASTDAIQHNLDKLNEYRREAGSPPLKLSDQLNAFAQQGSEEL